MDKKLCKECKYYRVSKEYWHDHYLIPEHYFCVKNNKFGDEIEKNKESCPNFEPWDDDE